MLNPEYNVPPTDRSKTPRIATNPIFRDCFIVFLNQLSVGLRVFGDWKCRTYQGTTDPLSAWSIARIDGAHTSTLLRTTAGCGGPGPAPPNDTPPASDRVPQSRRAYANTACAITIRWPVSVPQAERLAAIVRARLAAYGERHRMPIADRLAWGNESPLDGQV